MILLSMYYSVALLCLLNTLCDASDCDGCVKGWEVCLETRCKTSVDYPEFGSCEWNCKARRRKCFEECLKQDKANPARLLAKPSRLPIYDSEKKAQLLVHIDPSLQSQGFHHLAIYHIHTSAIVHTVNSTELHMIGNHVDRQRREWYMLSIPVSSYPCGVVRFKAVVYGKHVKEEFPFHIVKAPHPRNSHYYIDHKLDSIVDTNNLPVIVTGMYIFRGEVKSGSTMVPDLEAPRGFSTIITYLDTTINMSTILTFMDRSFAVGMNVILNLDQYVEKPNTKEIYWEQLQNFILQVKDHPGLLGYYLADEPGGQFICPNVLDEAYEFVKIIDPYHPIFITFCCTDPILYAGSFDVGMVDPYPIPNAPLDMVTRVARVGKPFFLIGQSFGGGEHWERAPTPNSFGGGEHWERAPTPNEIRMMIYYSILAGGTGFIYFALSPWDYPYSTSLWSECRTLALEALDLSAGLLSGIPHINVTTDNPSVIARVFTSRLNTYDLVVLNTANVPTFYKADIGMDVTYTGEVRYENRQVQVENGLVGDLIGAYSTAVIRFPQPQIHTLPNNILHNPSTEQVTSAATPDAAYLGVATDRSSTYFADPRISYDGLYSIRTTTPVDNGGHSIEFYPAEFEKGTLYEISAWVYSAKPGMTVMFHALNSFKPLGPMSYTVNNPNVWGKFSVKVNCTDDSDAMDIGYQQQTNGTVWVDLYQMIPLN